VSSGTGKDFRREKHSPEREEGSPEIDQPAISRLFFCDVVRNIPDKAKARICGAGLAYDQTV